MIQMVEKDLGNLLDQQKQAFVYVYTPLCGTCQVAGKMLDVVEELMPNRTWLKADLNFVPQLAEQAKIESVPCLIVINRGEVQQKIYAFHSVPFLYDQLKCI